jgi:phosphomannomutase/phosphoglucomutase
LFPIVDPRLSRVFLATALLLLAPAVLRAEDADKAAAQAAATAVQERVAVAVQQLANLAADPAVANLLRTGDERQLEAKAGELAGAIEGALKLRLIPRGGASTDMDAGAPLTFGSLAMITRAETEAQAVPAEVQVFGTPGQHLALVQRVEDSQGLAGVLHLSLSLDAINQAFTSTGAKQRFELRQDTGGPKPWMVAATSEDAAPKGRAIAFVPIAGTALRVAYWPKLGSAPVPEPGAARPETGSGWGRLLLVVLLGLAAAGGVALVLMRRRGPGGEPATEAGTQFKGAIAAILQGAYPGVEQFIPSLPPRTGKLRPASAAEQEMLASIASRAAAAAGVAKPASGLEVTEQEPPTTVMKVPPAPTPPAEPRPSPASALDAIFRTYDIRGVVGEGLTEQSLYLIAKALGSEAAAQGQSVVVVGRDGRNSSPGLSKVLIQGLRDSGRDVIDIGMVPTPVLYFATHYLDTGSGVMLTGSHNPPQYNGLKIVLNGQALSGEAIKAIQRRMQSQDFTAGEGALEATDIIAEYIQRITEDIPLALDKALRIVVDCGNSVPGVVAPRLLTALGHDVIELYCDVDGNFPNHHPDPSQPGNLTDLIDAVRQNQADLGFAFDGDGDRLGVVDADGNIIWPDRQMMLYARDVLSRNRGAEIIFDVKCSRHLPRVIKAAGGKPVMWKTGHSLIKAKMRETGSPLAGEMSGHIFFKERWYGFDDAMYTAARLVEILTSDGRPPKEVFAGLPTGVATPELRIDMPESRHAAFMQKLVASARFEGAEVNTIDGLRVDFPNAWGLIRPSNTTPVLVARFEGDDAAALAQIQSRFRALIQQVDNSLKIPF